MLWDKGVGEFVSAARTLRERGAQARFALVGDSDPANRNTIPRAQLHEWHASGAVEWWDSEKTCIGYSRWRTLHACHRHMAKAFPRR